MVFSFGLTKPCSLFGHRCPKKVQLDNPKRGEFPAAQAVCISSTRAWGLICGNFGRNSAFHPTPTCCWFMLAHPALPLSPSFSPTRPYQASGYQSACRDCNSWTSSIAYLYGPSLKTSNRWALTRIASLFKTHFQYWWTIVLNVFFSSKNLSVFQVGFFWPSILKVRNEYR